MIRKLDNTLPARTCEVPQTNVQQPCWESVPKESFASNYLESICRVGRLPIRRRFEVANRIQQIGETHGLEQPGRKTRGEAILNRLFVAVARKGNPFDPVALAELLH